jgi:uncharacterized membrane protein HdeD (DUF308 family)
MSDRMMMRPTIADSLQSNWGWFLALGVVFIIGGVLAIGMPLLAGITLTLVIGWLLIFVGALGLVQSWRLRGTDAFIWQLIISLIMLVGGIAIIVDPIVATVALTLLLGATFIAKGVVQVLMGFQMRPHSAWGWIVAAGALAVVVGILIVASWPSSAEWALGTLAGISLIFSGWSYVMIALAARQLTT